MDPGIVIALVSLLGVAYTAYRAEAKDRAAARKESKEDAMTATVELNKVTIEADITRESLHDKMITEHFVRLENQISKLEARVEALETDRSKMLTWMAFNKLTWPPPEGEMPSY